jgi:hypothetical protein
MKHKLFNVVDDMQGMTSDQLKGAVRNMEEIGNMLYEIFRALVNEDTDSRSVMGLDWDRFRGFIDELYLPSADGGTVIVSRQRSTSLLRWQLEFFHKFGNLMLETDVDTTSDGLKVQFSVSSANINTPEEHGYSLYVQTKQERERSNAALYESMSKTKRP